VIRVSPEFRRDCQRFGTGAHRVTGDGVFRADAVNDHSYGQIKKGYSRVRRKEEIIKRAGDQSPAF
jgi:hypothetical protein